jgi:hypothetical protein
MASDDKKIKTSPAPKSEPPVKDKSASDADLSKPKGGETAAAPSKAKGVETAAAPSKAKGDETAAAPSSGYSRGEGQKPVSQAYKDNWNAIFAKRKKKR